MSTPSNARVRMEFARRVAKELHNIEGAELLGPDPDVSEASLSLPHADFLLVVLDLRLRVFLDVDNLDDAGAVPIAQQLLNQWSDSTAVMVVSNDEQLTSRVFEPFDVLTQASGDSPSATEGPGPLGQVLRSYLHVLSIEWRPPPSLSDVEPLEIWSMAIESAGRAIQDTIGTQARVPEKQQALESLAGLNADVLADLTLLIVGGVEDGLSPQDIVRRLGSQQ